MSTAAAAVPTYGDFQEEVVFGTPDIVAREATRYLAFAGDVITPQRKQQRKDLAHGGEEFSSLATMWRARGFLRRGRITPLEYGARWDIPERTPAGTMPIAVISHQGNPSVLESSALVGIPCFPGEEITSLLIHGDEGTSMGIREIESLRGVAWSDFVKAGYQELLFPTYPDLPPTLRELVESVNRIVSSDKVVNEIKQMYNDSAAQFMLWGQTRVEQENQLLRTPSSGGFVYSYSPLAEVLLPQLEIPRQDQGMRTMATLTGKITEAMLNQQQSSGTPADMERIFRMLAENQEHLIKTVVEAMKGTGTTTIDVTPEPEAASTKAAKKPTTKD